MLRGTSMSSLLNSMFPSPGNGWLVGEKWKKSHHSEGKSLSSQLYKTRALMIFNMFKV